MQSPFSKAPPPGSASSRRKAGRALHEAGSTVEYALGQINASPEFFPGIYPQITPIFTDDEAEIPASSI